MQVLKMTLWIERQVLFLGSICLRKKKKRVTKCFYADDRIIISYMDINRWYLNSFHCFSFTINATIISNH